VEKNIENIIMNNVMVLMANVELLHLTVLSSRGCQLEYGDCKCSIGFIDCPGKVTGKLRQLIIH